MSLPRPLSTHLRAPGRHAFFCLLLLAASMPAAADSRQPLAPPGAIVVTIKPLYSLLAQLTDGITTPVLLMNETQSPHHYNMRPSERRLLASASLIVWVGPQMETNLSSIISRQSATVVSVMQAQGLHLLDKRAKHAHHDGDDDSDHDTEHNTGHNNKHNDHEAASHEMDKVDPHIWLSSHNAAAISRQLHQQLIRLDAANAQIYHNNLLNLLTRINDTAAFIENTLQHNRQPFISFHDAFQYFEVENGLNYANSINFDEETGTSLKHLRRIRASMDQQNIQCLVYQPPKPAIIDALTRDSTAQAVALDPLGLNVADDDEAWFELMRDLARGFSRCLTAAKP